MTKSSLADRIITVRKNNPSSMSTPSSNTESMADSRSCKSISVTGDNPAMDVVNYKLKLIRQRKKRQQEQSLKTKDQIDTMSMASDESTKLDLERMKLDIDRFRKDKMRLQYSPRGRLVYGDSNSDCDHRRSSSLTRPLSEVVRAAQTRSENHSTKNSYRNEGKNHEVDPININNESSNETDNLTNTNTSVEGSEAIKHITKVTITPRKSRKETIPKLCDEVNVGEEELFVLKNDTGLTVNIGHKKNNVGLDRDIVETTACNTEENNSTIVEDNEICAGDGSTKRETLDCQNEQLESEHRIKNNKKDMFLHRSEYFQDSESSKSETIKPLDSNDDSTTNKTLTNFDDSGPPVKNQIADNVESDELYENNKNTDTAYGGDRENIRYTNGSICSRESSTQSTVVTDKKKQKQMDKVKNNKFVKMPNVKGKQNISKKENKPSKVANQKGKKDKLDDAASGQNSENQISCNTENESFQKSDDGKTSQIGSYKEANINGHEQSDSTMKTEKETEDLTIEVNDPPSNVDNISETDSPVSIRDQSTSRIAEHCQERPGNCVEKASPSTSNNSIGTSERSEPPIILHNDKNDRIPLKRDTTESSVTISIASKSTFSKESDQLENEKDKKISRNHNKKFQDLLRDYVLTTNEETTYSEQVIEAIASWKGSKVLQKSKKVYDDHEKSKEEKSETLSINSRSLKDRKQRRSTMLQNEDARESVSDDISSQNTLKESPDEYVMVHESKTTATANNYQEQTDSASSVTETIVQTSEEDKPLRSNSRNFKEGEEVILDESNCNKEEESSDNEQQEESEKNANVENGKTNSSDGSSVYSNDKMESKEEELIESDRPVSVQKSQVDDYKCPLSSYVPKDIRSPTDKLPLRSKSKSSLHSASDSQLSECGGGLPPLSRSSRNFTRLQHVPFEERRYGIKHIDDYRFGDGTLLFEENKKIIHSSRVDEIIMELYFAQKADYTLQNKDRLTYQYFDTHANFARSQTKISAREFLLDREKTFDAKFADTLKKIEENKHRENSFLLKLPSPRTPNRKHKAYTNLQKKLAFVIKQ